jgi:hypothetical protein
MHVHGHAARHGHPIQQIRAEAGLRKGAQGLLFLEEGLRVLRKYAEDARIPLLHAVALGNIVRRERSQAQGGLPAVFADPTLALYGAFYGAYRKLQPQANLGREQLADGSRAFTAGLMAWKKGEPSYPDANSTMRLTYGKVGAYSPKDGVTYKFYTTLTGVMEKEDPNNYEFIVPAKLKALYAAKDFGPYAMDDGRVPTCFLTNNDITGGNSGSPVLDADGCLIGLAFDGNWESMSSDVMFEPDLQRCICVDIRYVLFLVDKLGGASHIVEELELVK